MSEKKEEEVKLTPEELKVNREKVIEYYKNQIEVLEFQVKHETLMAEIEAQRAKRLEMIIRQAQMRMGPEQEKESEKEEDAERNTPGSQEVAPEIGDVKLRILKKTD